MNRKSCFTLRQIVFAAVTLLFGSLAAAAEPPTVDAQGDLHMPAFTVPFSSYASPEARKLFLRAVEEDRNAPPLDAPIAELRAYYDKLNTARVERMQKLYPVRIEKRTIGGVPTQVVTPRQGIAMRQKNRVLINLHGGGMMFGAGSGGLVESIPVAGTGGIEVITVDYRMAPEHVFPAASEDVAAVYRELLKRYPAKNIGIYGCSAGGGLAGQSVAWFVHNKMPIPGAIGIFCASVVDEGGDSAYLAPVLDGEPPMDKPFSLGDLPYLKGASFDDPLVGAGNSPELLAKFPPTLLITGTRDPAMSPVIQTQRLLTNAGVDAELHVWDGMWHSFFSDPEMPESREAYNVMVRFFDRHLGR